MTESAISVLRAYQDTYDWNDNTMLALIMEWLDEKGLVQDFMLMLKETAQREADAQDPEEEEYG